MATRQCITTALSSAVGGCAQVVGFEEIAKILPQSIVDRAGITYESGELIVNNLDLLGGAKGKTITVKGDLPYKETAIAGTMGAYVQLFESTLTFPILENSPASAKQVMELGNDHYLVVLQCKDYTAAKKNKYMIMGINRGLMFNTGNLANDSQENGGWRITLKEMEGLVPVCFYWDTDETASDLWFAGLTA